MTHSSRRGALLHTTALAAVALAVLAACGSPASTSASSQGAVTATGAALDTVKAAKAAVAEFEKVPTKINATVPLTGKVNSGTYVVIGCELPQCKVISDGATAAARAIGWQVKYLQYATTDGATLTSAMKEALTYSPIAVSPIGFSQALWTQLQPDYKAAKVPIVPIAVGDVKTSDVVTLGSSSQVDYGRSGELMANWFTADSGAAGKALVMDVPAFAVLKAYGDAFKAKVPQVCKACSVTALDIAPAQLATNGVVPAIVSALQKDPSITYLVATDGAFLSGLPAAMAAAGITTVKIAGGAADISNSQALVAGTEAAWTLEPTDQFGWVAVDIAARTLLGMPVEQDKILRPQLLATKDNVGTPANFLAAPTDYQAQYKKLWGMS